MRPIVVASSLAALAAVGYLALPGSETPVSEPTARAEVTEAQTPAPVAAPIGAARPATPERPRMRAPESSDSQRVARREPRAAEPERVARRERAPIERAQIEREPSMHEVTGLTSVSGTDRFDAKKAIVSADKQPRAQANLANPMDERWIDDLSGPRARLSMGKESAGGCASCERAPAPKDMSLVGVVVESEEIIKHPEMPLTGEVKRGHYKDHTPAVYVK